MTKKSEQFEKQIKRIHQLIEQPGSEVTWDDHISDPDNPMQDRQIDITIRREGKITLIECRTHKGKQDVTWIEELIGRRMSLKADAVIAVSSSGFSAGAIKKAKAFGIILRDFVNLTLEEISNWGHSTDVALILYKFEDVHVIYHFRPEDIAVVKPIHFNAIPRDHFLKLLNLTANKIEFEHIKGDNEISGEISLSFGNDDLRIGNCPVVRIDFSTKFKRIVQKVRIPSVVAYDAPEIDITERGTFIEKFGVGEFEITQSANNVFVAVDVSTVEVPPNCLFVTFCLDFKRIVTIQGFEFVGLPPFEVLLDKLKITASFLPIASSE